MRAQSAPQWCSASWVTTSSAGLCGTVGAARPTTWSTPSHLAPAEWVRGNNCSAATTKNSGVLMMMMMVMTMMCVPCTFYHVTCAQIPKIATAHQPLLCAGIAVSSNGIDWVRGTAAVAGDRDDDRDLDVGEVLGCNPDWWTFDTRCVGVSDVQVRQENAVTVGDTDLHYSITVNHHHCPPPLSTTVHHRCPPLSTTAVHHCPPPLSTTVHHRCPRPCRYSPTTMSAGAWVCTGCSTQGPTTRPWT